MTTPARFAISAAIVAFSTLLAAPHAAAQGCTIGWDGGGGNNFWQNRFNWNPDRLPNATDNVCSGPNVILSDFFSHRINSITGGSLTIPSSGTFLTITAGGTLSGSLTIQGGQVENNGTLTVMGSVTIRNGSLIGIGTTDVSTGMTLDGLVDLARQTINHRGVATMVSSATRLRMWGSAVFNNLAGATFNAVDAIGFDLGDSGSAFNNYGTFVKAASVNSSTGFGGVPFNNTGTVDIQRGSLRFLAGFTQSAGSTVLNASTVETTTLPLTIRGGTLTGIGTVIGNVMLAGTGVLSPGGPGQAGVINISGGYTQTELGTVNAEIGGTTPALVDRLLITGNATLGGALNVNVINGFSPTPGAQFPIMSFAVRSGAFASVNASGLTAQLNDTNVTMIAGSTCEYQVVLSDQSVPAAGGAVGTTITTGAGCAWAATDFDDWIDIVPNAGTSSTTIAIGVGPNTGGPRVALVIIAGKSFSINQAAATCEYTLSSAGQSFTAQENTGAFNIGTRADCSWTAQTNIPWIQITSASTGLGEGQVQFHIDANASPPIQARTGSIDVSGSTFTIEQAAPTLACTPGAASVVLDRYQSPNVLFWDRKPWRIAYGRLELVFSITDQTTHCQADSNVGALPVIVTNPLIPIIDIPVANSVASATLRVYRPDTEVPPAQCEFSRIPGVGINNDCLLNASSPGAYYAQWTTTGFDTDILYPGGSLRCGPCHAGPFTFWVNLSARGLVPELGVPFDTILREAETFIHRTMIDNLVAIDPLAFVQDPGNVNLVVVDRQGRATGRLRDGRMTNDVPYSLYLHDALYPAVLLFGPPSIAPFQVQLFGRQAGEYDLAIDSTRAPVGAQVGQFSGLIALGQTLGFAVGLTPTGEPTASAMTVLEADLTGDGLVTCADLTVVRTAFGRRTGQPGFNAWADKVFPGVIDVRDLAFVAQRLPAGTVCQ